VTEADPLSSGALAGALLGALLVDDLEVRGREEAG
jgi:hypothetical protein